MQVWRVAPRRCGKMSGDRGRSVVHYRLPRAAAAYSRGRGRDGPRGVRSMSPSCALAELAQCLDELLLRPGNMPAARRLAEACLNDPEQGRVEALQFPEYPANPFLGTDEAALRERGEEETLVLTPAQRALALAALHAVYCRGFEPVLATPAEVPEFDGEGRVTDEYRRADQRSVPALAYCEALCGLPRRSLVRRRLLLHPDTGGLCQGAVGRMGEGHPRVGPRNHP